MLLRPGSVKEVQAILKLANETKTPLVPQGGNTGLVGGQIPFDGELILSLTRLLKVSGVASRVTNAGIASVKSDQTTRPIDSVISKVSVAQTARPRGNEAPKYDNRRVFCRLHGPEGRPRCRCNSLFNQRWRLRRDSYRPSGEPINPRL